MTHAALIAALVLIAPSQQPELKPVEEGFEDVSPLASPNRLEPIDLRRPTGFEQVYEITTPTGEKAFVRIDNGLVAIFDRSDYLAGTDRAFIPPNTRFKIGTQGLTARSDQTIETTPASAESIGVFRIAFRIVQPDSDPLNSEQNRHRNLRKRGIETSQRSRARPRS